MRETVPLLSYGVQLSQAAATFAVFPLWTLPNLLTEFEGTIEDDAFQDITIHSIVGTLHIDHAADPASTGLNVIRIMALQADLETGTLQPPWVTWSMWDHPGPANLRFLMERIDSPLVVRTIDDGHGRVMSDNPWHANVVTKGAMRFGRRHNLWPALCVENNAAVAAFRMMHRLRAFVSFR